MSGNIFIKLKPYQAVASTRLVRVADALFYNEYILPSISCGYLYIHDAVTKCMCVGVARAQE